MEEVKVLGLNLSPFSLRVEIALKLKGVDYEFVEENPMVKSEQLLKHNPIYKKIPVFIHQGKTLVESLFILEYIDEHWKDNPIFPSDPYERAQARFWANFIDDKLLGAVIAMLLAQEEEKEKCREELQELLTIFQREVEGKKFLGGENIGHLDLVAILAAHWVPVLLEVIDEKIITRPNFSGFFTWADHLLGLDIVRDIIPKRETLVAFYRVQIPVLRAQAQST